MEIKTHLDFDYRGIGKIFNDLEKAETFAVKRTLSRTAFNTMQDGRVIADRKMILRNTYSKRNIVYQNTTGSTIANMESKAGATKRADWLRFQEYGGKRTSKSGNIMVPTNAARGEKNSRMSSHKIVSKKNYRERYGLIKGGLSNSSTKKANNVARMFVAWREKVLIPINGSLFRVYSFSKPSNGSVVFEKEMMYKQEFKTVTKKRDWLFPAAENNGEKMQETYNDEMEKSIDRWMSGKFK